MTTYGTQSSYEFFVVRDTDESTCPILDCHSETTESLEAA